MKTTIQISEPLFQKATRLARKEKTTLRALVEEGLRRVIAEHGKRSRFHLKDVSFGKGGLRPEVEGAGWDRLRDIIYEGRGS